jgi:AcrR family transcriptional regulator
VSADVDVRILVAALELLEEHGVARLTVEATAERAGVAKTTIYRRYRNAADLATAALAHSDEVGGALSGGDPDDLRATLLAFLTTLGTRLERVGLDVLGAMLTEPEGELLALHRRRMVLPHRDRLAGLIAAAQARGEVRDDADPLLLIELLVGSFFARHVAGREMAVEAWAEAALDLVWRGLEPDPR